VAGREASWGLPVGLMGGQQIPWHLKTEEGEEEEA